MQEKMIKKENVGITFLHVLERVSGVSILNNQEYENLSMRFMPHGDYINSDNMTTVYLTDEQLHQVIQKLAPLAKA